MCLNDIPYMSNLLVPCVVCMCLRNCSSVLFHTLDEISTYQLDILPVGSPLKRLQIIHALVTWDNEDGLPTVFNRVSFRKSLLQSLSLARARRAVGF